MESRGGEVDFPSLRLGSRTPIAQNPANTRPFPRRSSKSGESLSLSYPVGMASDEVIVVKLARTAKGLEARKAGATLGKKVGKSGLAIWAGSQSDAAEIAFGATLRAVAGARLEVERVAALTFYPPCRGFRNPTRGAAPGCCPPPEVCCRAPPGRSG